MVAKARGAAPERGVPWSWRRSVSGAGAKSTGAAKSLAPARYWPIMKIMWAAVTRTAQSTLIWPSMADRVGPEVCMPTAVKPSRCASTRGWPRTQMKRTAAMVSVAVRRSTSCSGCGVNGEGGVPCPGGSWAPSNSWDPTAAEGLEVPASERGVLWGAARVHHAEVVSRARHTRR